MQKGDGMRKTLVAALALTAGIIITALPAAAGERMPAAQQNALVGKYCAVCHSDAHRNGGLSLEHFDAAHADPGVAAMLISKLTSGVPLKSIAAAQTNPDVAATVARKMKTGAMGASGVPVPDRATQDALVNSLSTEAAGASDWTMKREPALVRASLLREVPSAANAGDADLYRLVLTCNPDTHEGEMLVAWAPGTPKKGQTLTVTADGNAPVSYALDNSEKTFPGATGTSGTGAVILRGMPLPKEKLTVGNLFGGDAVVFPFDGMATAERQTFSACFGGAGAH